MTEVRLALRRLARRPNFTLPAVGTLAVGIGATAAIFSAVNAALLEPLPYAEPEELHTLATARVDGLWSNGRVPNAEMTAIAAAAPSVVAVAGASVASRDVIVADDGRNQQVNFRAVTPGFFELAGVPLALGSGSFVETSGGGYGAVVLSHRIWESLYAGDPDIVGATVRLASGSATVIGVTPRLFDLPQDTDLWLVDTFAPTSGASLEGFVRVRPGTSLETLRSELAAVMSARVEDGLGAGGRVFVATPLVTSIVGDLGPILWIVLAAATVLLALGCVNVASLILARGRTQIREIAIRKALGASRGHVLRQLPDRVVPPGGTGHRARFGDRVRGRAFAAGARDRRVASSRQRDDRLDRARSGGGSAGRYRAARGASARDGPSRGHVEESRVRWACHDGEPRFEAGSVRYRGRRGRTRDRSPHLCRLARPELLEPLRH